jgi:formamidopyrimidine-DNA glycosylase
MEGQVIARAQVNRPDLRWPFPPAMAERLTGRHVIRLGRRSKYLLADLEGGQTLLIHLGMSGRMTVSADPSDPGFAAGQLGHFVHHHSMPEKHDHVVLEMGNGARITFNDPRRFGMMDLIATDGIEGHRLLAGLGPEPLGNGFHAAGLLAAFNGRRAPVKAALLDQRIVAGLGNIYVCESLFRSGISPTRQAGRISPARIAVLVSAIRDVLAQAIEAGGSSLRDFRQAGGELGYFQHVFDVYGREGQPCHRDGCPGVIRRIVQSGRSSFFCPQCQR